MPWNGRSVPEYVKEKIRQKLSKPKPCCSDCGKVVSNWAIKRCRSCHHKFQDQNDWAVFKNRPNRVCPPDVREKIRKSLTRLDPPTCTRCKSVVAARSANYCRPCFSLVKTVYTPEEIKQHQREWRRKNRDKVNFWTSQRRKRLENADGSHTYEEWVAVKEKFNNRCARCQHPDRPVTQDHIIPLKYGGSNYISNIQPLCGRCNSSKSAKYPWKGAA